MKELSNQSFFCVYKIYLISAKGYTNAGVNVIRVRKTGKCLNLVLKEIYGRYGTKNPMNK